ncbi:hypothetical protein BH10PAT1_BH10PAT1_1840 [soil metagenome]
MQKNPTYSEITNLILTKDDFNILIRELDLLEESLYEIKNNFDSVLKNSVRSEVSKLISNAILNQDKAKVLKEIRLEMNQIKFAEIILAKDPSNEFISKISDWLTKLQNRRIAINIKIDQSIIGGAIISFEGKYFDGSLKNKLEKILINYV